jgi:geranylgeranyl reductase family protein
MIDKSHFPRDKPCGGMVSARALNELDFETDEIVQQTYYEGRLFRPKGDFFTLKSQSRLAIGVLRNDFDTLLARKAESEGVAFEEGRKVETVTINKAGASVSCSGGFKATSEVVIAADGADSMIAKQIGIRTRLQPDELSLACVYETKLGIEAITNLGFDSLEFYLGLTPAGYGWIFPKGDYLSVGAGSPLKELHQSRSMFPDFVKKIKKLQSINFTNLKWHLVPVGGKQTQTSKNRVLLTGDAACLVDPLTGEGIAYSILSGKKAALSIKSAFEIGSPEKSSAIYSRFCKDILVDLRKAHFIANGIYHYPDLMLSPFFVDKRLGDSLTGVITGEKNYGEFILDLIRRMPISISMTLVSHIQTVKL